MFSGATGGTGPQGQLGARGPIGVFGPPGYTGLPGFFGRQGYTGATGLRGLAGTTYRHFLLTLSSPCSCLCDKVCDFYRGRTVWFVLVH